MSKCVPKRSKADVHTPKKHSDLLYKIALFLEFHQPWKCSGVACFVYTAQDAVKL